MTPPITPSTVQLEMLDKVAGTLPNGAPYTFGQLLQLTKPYAFRWNGAATFVATFSGVLAMSVCVALIAMCAARYRERKMGRMVSRRGGKEEGSGSAV